jgi:hypothetical protein
MSLRQVHILRNWSSDTFRHCSSIKQGCTYVRLKSVLVEVLYVIHRPGQSSIMVNSFAGLLMCILSVADNFSWHCSLFLADQDVPL